MKDFLIIKCLYKTKKTLPVLSVIFYCFTSCSQKQKTTVKTSPLKIIVERGAFHYDTFILKDSIINFYPQENNGVKNGNKYYSKSHKKISQLQLKNFIDHLKKSNLWYLKNNYQSNSSCSSMLKVTIEMNMKKKIIECEDFKNDCPDIIQYIESEIITMHGKQLKRVRLPG